MPKVLRRMEPLSVKRGNGSLLALANAAFSSGESLLMPSTAAPASCVKHEQKQVTVPECLIVELAV